MTLLRALPLFHAARVCDRLTRQLQEYLIGPPQRALDKFLKEEVTRKVVFIAESLPDYHLLTDLILWLIQHARVLIICFFFLVFLLTLL
jgi:hypothetical protein